VSVNPPLLFKDLANSHQAFQIPPDLVVKTQGFDHGVGHPLLLLYDAKTPLGQKVKEFNGLGDNPFNASVSLF
jgi:aromatic ring-opening dioxygenase catalytic subunit (LigB family)